MENKSGNKGLPIYHFLEVQMQLLRRYFAATRSGLDVEAIHQMRLAIKRIRTIRKLKKHIHFPSLLNDEQYASLKSIFAVSGQMRDLQVQQKLLAVYIEELGVNFDEFATYLDELEKHNAEQLKQAIQSFDVSLFDKLKQSSELDAYIENGPDIQTESTDFIHLKINKIDGLILLMDRDEFVHDLRKQVKQLFFILQFLKKHFPDNEFNAYKLRSLKEIGEQLGNWNDHEVLVKRLGEFLKINGETYPADHPQYKLLLHHLEAVKQKMLENVDVKLKGEIKELVNETMIECENARMLK